MLETGELAVQGPADERANSPLPIETYLGLAKKFIRRGVFHVKHVVYYIWGRVASEVNPL